MRKLPLVLLVPVLAAIPALGEPARGQTPVQPQVVYSRQRQVSIPFDPDPSEAHRLKQLQLYYSNDQGRTWHLGATAAPDKKKFSFEAEGDGYYLFAVQTTDTAGRLHPEKKDGLIPAMRVVFDSMPPTVILKPLPPRGNEVGVTWEIRDDNLDTRQDAIQLEYRAAGAGTWQPLFRQNGVTQQYWAVAPNILLDVRIHARDLAGNTADATTQVGLSGQGNAGGPGAIPGNDNLGGGAGASGDPNRRYINSKTISLNYEITDKGPSGVSGIDLWYTIDGRGWSKFQLPKNAVNDATFKGPLRFDVQNEGVYGFTLIAKSGVNTSVQPPQVGEKPQIWIEVDLTKPVVELQTVLIGSTESTKGQLKIGWLARDKNFGKTPIALAYGTTQDGPWTSIERNLANTGLYIWTMPAHGGMPWQFYLKVEATDLAGNVGEAITQGLVKIDTKLPQVTNITAQPGGR